MVGYTRVGTPLSVTATTTPSPPSSPRLRAVRSKPTFGPADDGSSNSGGTSVSSGRGSSKQTLLERLVYVIVSVVLKQRGVLLFAPLLYISGMLLYMGSLNFDVDLNLQKGGVVVRKRAPPGSVYRSPLVFKKLWPYMEAENNGSHNNALMPTWDPILHQSWQPCGNNTDLKAELPQSNGFLIIEANGGLNQQRLSRLNVELDEVQGWLLGLKPLPSIREMIVEVRREGSQKKFMLTSPTSEQISQGSALVANSRKGSTQQA